MLPDYIAKASPNPASNRAPWYTNTAPSYAGIFLWVVFYMQLAGGTLDRAGVGLSLVALLVGGLLSYFLFYRSPAMLGMQTGYPLYVVGSSTFGTKGGYLMPGLLMGALQAGWVSVNIFVSTTFIFSGLGTKSGPGSVPFTIVAILWGFGMSYVGVKGIKYVARFSTYLSLIPLLMILLAFFQTAGGIGRYTPPNPMPYVGFMMLIQIVIGFFATAGAAGADFGMNSRNKNDVKWGGLVGVTLAILVAGGLPILSVAGAHGLGMTQGYTYDSVIAGIGGVLGTTMFFLFALASVAPACFSAFIAGNSFSTMIPGVSRMASTMVAAAVAVLLAVTGVAGNLVNLFNVIGASFGPICGAMTADYLLSGRKWAGPRAGINWAGYIAWAAGFIVGILPFLGLPPATLAYLQPVAVYSFIVGFAVYGVLAKAGLQPEIVPLAAPAQRSSSAGGAR
jgi:cytosine permease